MAIRRESVEISVTSEIASVATRDAAAVALLRRELDGVNNHPFFQANSSGNLTNINRASTQTTQGLSNVRSEATRTEGGINQLTGRLSLLADGLLVLGPGLVPIAAVGAQALGGLTAAATAAAVAGGSALVAFQGLGDAVKAVQEYQLDPTVAGLEKARKAMSTLGPDAQRFVMEFQKFRPVLGDIKDAAAAGWFPGLTESLDKFATLGPQIEDIFFKAGQAGGFLVDSAAESLSSERWAPFLQFLEDEVPTAMSSLASIMGNLAHGAAKMFMAFDPGNDAFLGWLDDVAAGFDRWASSAAAQDSIEGLLEYARTNGPAVADLFSSLVGALSAIVKAAAPLGGPVLQGLTAVADMIKVIADSDIGTPLLAGVAALRLYSRAAAIATAAQGRLTAGVATTAAASTAASRGAALNAAGLTGTSLGSALLAPRPGSPGTSGASRFAPLLGGAAALAGVAIAAVAISKAAKANDELVDSFGTVQRAIDSLDFGGMTSSLEVSSKALADFKAKVEDGKGFGSLKNPDALLANTKSGIEGIFGKSDVEEADAAYADLEAQMQSSQRAAADLGNALGMTVGPLDGSVRSTNELQAALEAAKPAMDALNISAEDLTKAQIAQDRGGMLGVGTRAALYSGSDMPASDMAAQIAAQSKYMDSAQGKADNYTAALARLVREEGTASERARGLNDALEALINPANNAEAALSNVREALKTISELNAKGGFTVKTEVGRTNLAETRAYADAVKQRLVTMVEAKRSEEDVAHALEVSREQFIKSGVAAGFSAQQMRRRATAIGLTPKLVETTFQALGITKADRETQALRNLFDKLPKNVRTQIREEGAIPSRQHAMDLIKQLDIAAKPRKALLSLATQGEGNVAAAKRLMDSLQSKSVTLTTYVNTIRSERGSRGTSTYADGGFTGKGGKYEPAGIVHRGEVVIPQDLVKRDWPMLRSRYGHLPGFADGGMVGESARTRGGRRGQIDFDAILTFGVMADKAKDDVRHLGDEADKSSKAIREEAKQRKKNMRAYAQEVRGSVSGELTGGGLAGFDLANAANRNDSRAMLRALIKARKKGLSGPLLDLVAASGDLNLAEQMAALSRSEIAQRERQYGASRAAQNALGNFASREKFDRDGRGRGRGRGGRTTTAQLATALGDAVERGSERGTERGAGRASRQRSRRTAAASRARI